MPSPPPGGQSRRPRAPTITIDTSAVGRSSENLVQPEQDRRQPSAEGSSPMLRPTTGNSTPPELRKSGSFESRESRPTSPHNISSPTQVSHPQNFLAVPVQRKRGGSVDTDGGDTVSTTDTTYVGTDHQSPKVFGADDVKHGAGDHPVLSDKEALKPDPGTEADFERENNPFAFAPGHMTKLLNPKSLGAFHAMGGVAGLEKGLRTDRNSGLSVDEEELDGRVTFEEATAATSPAESDNTKVAAPPRTNSHVGAGTPQGSYQDRKRIFNDNRLPERKAKNIFQLAWMAYNDKILILLTVAAAIALALGIYQAVGQPHPPGEPGVEWVEGVAIIVAIVVVVSVGALNDWQKERQFVKLNKKKDARNVQVIRSGKAQEISVHDLLVGDLMVIEPGDILPVDGIYVTGHSVKCDESSATGESDILKKVGADEVYRAMENNENLRKMDPFMISGAKVTEGFGRMIVTATGIHSSYGKTMLALREDNEATPLQMKLNNLAEYIAKLGSAAALLLFVVLLIKFLAQLPGNNDSPAEKGQRFLDILIVAVTIVVVAVPEGLPLAVTLALAFATKRMLKDNNLVRVMRSCETMGNATCVCSDKTGTLTQNVMTVVAGSIGTSSRFNNRADTQVEAGKVVDETEQAQDDVDDVTAPEFVKTLSEDTATLWKDAIAINSTAFEAEEEGKMVYVGSKTETALLGFARDFLGMDKIAIERSNAEIVQLIPFDSGRKCMGVVVKLPTGGYRLLVKGASEIMLRHCKHIIRDPTMGIESTALSSSNKEMLEHLIDAYASRSLRTIGFIHRDFEAWPPKGARRAEDVRTQAVFEDVCKDMVFLGLVGIQDPLRPGVSESVADCIKAGVFPRMVTGDNINTAKAIAKECGIYTPGGLALEGPDFRKMSKHEQREIIPKLQVLARSSPEDKRILVRRLKEMGETVAVTGDGTNDAPALKAADVGFSMNIAGTEVAKEASDIILMDDNFTSIVKALMWGRAVNDAVRKFLQFQITVNITAVLLAFITAVASNQEESVLTAVQLLWVNLIMDTMAALALATDPPTRKILDRKPDPKSAPLISVTMWKMILGQAIYQLVITLVLNFAGPKIFHYDGEDEMEQLQTMVFNTFVWMQIFNSLNNRRLDNKFNIFEGIQRNWFFAGIFLIMVGGQTLIIFVGGRAFQVRRQFGDQWGVAIVLGAISIPIGIVIRLIPNELVVKLVPPFIKRWVNRPKKDELIVTDEENPWQFNQGLMDIKEELAWLRKYKGGRLRSLRFAVSHPKELLLGSRSPSRSRASSDAPGTPHLDASQKGDSASQLSHSPAPPTPDSRRRRNRSRSGSNVAFAGAAMAGIVAGSIGGWSPIERGRGDTDSLRFARERSKSDLSREVRRSAEVHPETREGDPVVVRDPVVSAAEEGAMHPPSQANETTPAFGLGPFGDQPPAATGDEGKKDGKD